MSFAPFLNTPVLIQLHAVFALLALILGPVAIYRRKHDGWHRIVGYVWVISMSAVAGTALFIPSSVLQVFGHFGPLHLLVLLAIWSLWTGMRAIFRGNIRAHKAAMSGLYWQGIAIAGLVNFLPDRMVNRMIFSSNPETGYFVIALGGIVLAMLALRQRFGFRLTGRTIRAEV